MQRRILIAEDNLEISDTMRNYLIRAGYVVSQAFDGGDAIEQARRLSPDLILLDIMMPVADGYEVCESIRRDMNIPIIVVSAKVAEEDKIRLFELGADDYVVKPFDAKEVVARVKAVLRRSAGAPAADIKQVEYDKLKINLTNYELWVDGKRIDTPPKELELIYHLASNPNRVFTRDQLLDEVWGFDYYGDSRTVDVHVKRLREKREGVSDKWELKTVWSVGYKFETKD